MVTVQKNNQSVNNESSSARLANLGTSFKNNNHKISTKEQGLFLQLLHNYPDGVISVIDKKYNFIYTGGQLHLRLSANPVELIGNKLYPKFPENIRKLIKAQLKKVFAGDRISAFELPGLIKGEFHIMDAFPLKENDDSIAYAGVIIRNISHLKIAEEELRISLRNEKELGELKSQFITMASHEFRTPLTTVLTSIQLIKNYPTGDVQKRDKHIARILASVNHLTDILDDFVTVGKIQQGNVLFSSVTFNIKNHITTIIEEFNNDLNHEHHILYKHSGKELVVLDPLLLKHIITNLLSNAIKFFTNKLLVEIKTNWKNGKLILSVKDHGMGIPPEYRRHLFEQFYRASNAINIQGTGLGLHLVSKYVTLMNGTIHYKSVLEKGTQFVINFQQDKI